MDEEHDQPLISHNSSQGLLALKLGLLPLNSATFWLLDSTQGHSRGPVLLKSLSTPQFYKWPEEVP